MFIFQGKLFDSTIADEGTWTLGKGNLLQVLESLKINFVKINFVLELSMFSLLF